MPRRLSYVGQPSGMSSRRPNNAAGVSISSIARARLDPASSAYRSPPEDWETVLARLARERTEDFKELAEQLERQAQGKRS